ncbi:MAG: PIG-L family deacetylase [Deltaproteobacteria bacterium]|nr:PIG-L family deacetylase [Deltaproteobacteria bacterium]MBW2307197.1 PIG-L family deacetylase [Deltaproteobacteria bacterium]
MEKLGPLLALFAHPDDEGIIGGTLAFSAAEGHPVTLICLTRGQAGKSSYPAITTPEALAHLRKKELQEACRILGVSDLRHWDYMDGRLDRADANEVVGRIVEVMREVRPEVVITFGPEGIYGHPDHLAAHRLVREAYYAAGDPRRYPQHLDAGHYAHQVRKLYYVAFPKSFFEGPNPRRRSRTMEINGVTYYFHAIDDEEISTVVDVSAFTERKIDAYCAHQSQALPGSTRATLSRESMVKNFALEYLIRAEPPWDGKNRESNIFQ